MFDGGTDDPNFASAAWADQVDMLAQPPRGKVIGVVAAKGGVGKSSMSLWLAQALTAAGQKVALCDANIGQADISKMIGVDGHSPGLSGLIGGGRFTSDELTGMSVNIPELGSVLIGPAKPINTKLDEALAALNLAVRLFAATHDYVVIDAPVATVYEPIYSQSVLHVADLLFVVMNPYRTMLQDTAIWLDGLYKPKSEGGAGWPKAKCVGVLNQEDPDSGIDAEMIDEWMNGKIHVAAAVPKVDDTVLAMNLRKWKCPQSAKPAMAKLVSDVFDVYPGSETGVGKTSSKQSRSKKGKESTSLWKKMFGLD